ncbi:unnamed protein product [Phaedon cochleariae]|uniref:Uncharacterized protein n=1 Tax=Phaedon cochleariae TaxID=80249 RepID=A0A9N9X124_PHACE|nr:unnamed protein product [Phaedon cochleariae]
MYGVKHVDKVNQARLELFHEAYKTNDSQESFVKNIRNCDASNLPPCSSELRQQILRSSYIASIWLNAHLQQPTEKLPENYGLIINDNKYEFLWFEGDQMPQYISDVLTDSSSENSKDEKGDNDSDMDSRALSDLDSADDEEGDSDWQED